MMEHLMLKSLNSCATWIEAKKESNFIINTILPNLVNTTELYPINDRLYQTKGIVNINYFYEVIWFR